MQNQKKILFIVGTHNQTTMMHQIYMHLKEAYDCYFSTYYADGFIRYLAENGFLENTILGNKTRNANQKFYEEHDLQEDYRGKKHQYDLVYLCQDAIVPKNLLGKKIILVQEGTIMPKDWRFYLTKGLNLPRYFSDTALFGLSDTYQYLCVASEGYKKEFISRGVNADRIKVTGIPNFDWVDQFRNNDFPHQDFVLVATSNLRESKRPEDRISLIKKAKAIAKEKLLIFKLHPGENFARAINEINAYAPKSLIYTEGKIEEMIANCNTLITRYSSVLLIGAALQKRIYCEEYSMQEIKELSPIQNGGTSARIIANLGRFMMTDTQIKSSAPVRLGPIPRFAFSLRVNREISEIRGVEQ